MDRKKCTRCKVNLLMEEFKVRRDGNRTKMCIVCLEKDKKYKKKCEHGRSKNVCKECGGSQICPHQKVKYQCKECKGGSICKHNRSRTSCKECKGGSICEHDKQRTYCKMCKGGSVCPHGRQKSYCRDCHGSQICIHDKRKGTCKDCKGNQICSHGKIKTCCKDCDGGSICGHGRVRSHCRECGGGSFCSHDKIRSRCKDCRGGSVCEHNIQKSSCKECDFDNYLARLVRRRIHHALKSDKNKKSLDYLGCDVETFKKHMEDQFEEGMTWENHGKSSPKERKWEIDHITPLKYREPTLEEVIERLHYTNTQPLWGLTADLNSSKIN